MIELESDANRVRIVDWPIGHWIGALIALIISTVMLVGLIRNFPSSFYQRAFGIAVFSWIFAGFIYWAKSPMRETIIDANLHTVSVSTLGLFSRRFVKLRFEDIEGGAIVESREKDSRTVFLIRLLRKEGGPLTLTEEDDLNEVETIRAADRINKILGLTIEDRDFQPRMLDLD